VISETQPDGLDLPRPAWDTLLAIEREASRFLLKDVPFDHSYGRLPGEVDIGAWSVPRPTGLFLLSLVRLLRPRRVLEIGTSLAYSTIWLASGLQRDARLDTVEVLEAKARLARKHLLEAAVENVLLHVADATTIVAEWQSPVDFLFLDADPENYVYYLESLESVLSDRAVLVMDNALNHAEVTRPFADHIRASRRWNAWIHPQDNGLLLARRGGSEPESTADHE